MALYQWTGGSRYTPPPSLLGKRLANALQAAASGTTGNRPTASTLEPGTPYIDTTLGQPIWSNGTAWLNYAGTVV